MVPRLITTFGIELQTPGSDQPIAARPVNLCTKGTCIRLKNPLKYNENIKVKLRLSNEHHPFDALAKVVWQRQDPITKQYYYGLKFTDKSDKQTELINQYIEQGSGWLLNFLSEFPLFSEFSADDCRSLLQIITLRQLAPKEVLYRANQQDNDMQGLFIIQQGLLNIYKSAAPEPENQLTTVSAGQIFGEISLITENQHSATVVAVNPTTLIQISKTGFMLLRKENPQLGLKIMDIIVKVLANRLGRATTRLFSPVHI